MPSTAMGKILLGFNCNCFTNRYSEPSVWPRLCAEMGVRHVMFNTDLIDPYWSWETQKRLCHETLENCEKHGIKIFASFGGHNNHQHYLGHPDEGAREEAVGFYKRAIRQTALLGGRSYGTCFAIMTQRCDSDGALRSGILEAAIESYHALAEYAAEAGLPALSYEMTSVSRESCATFSENDYVLARCSDMAVPMRICLDVGHRNASGHGDQGERDHLQWIRRYASHCDVIDCQQTGLAASSHWPFTPENNKLGVIKPDEVVGAIEQAGVGHDILLAFEIRTPAFYPQDGMQLEGLRASVEYWKGFIKESE